MKVLIWAPINIKGGGQRLLVNLVSAMARHKEIEKLRIVLSSESKGNSIFKQETESIETYYYPIEEIEEIEETKLIKENICKLNNEMEKLDGEIKLIEKEISNSKNRIEELKQRLLNINIPDVLADIVKRGFKTFLVPKIVLMSCLQDYFKLVSSLKEKINKETNRLTELKYELKEKINTIEEIEKGKNIKKRELENIEREIEREIKEKPVDYCARDCDLVYFFWPHFIEFQYTTKPSVCTFQDITILDFPENIGGRNATIYYNKTKKWLEETTITVTSSDYTRRKLIEYFGLRDSSIVVIPHRGSPVEYFKNKNTPKDVFEKYKLPREYIIYPANLGFHKNHYNLLIAYSRFKYRKEYPLVLFGWLTELLNQVPPDYPELINCARLVSLIQRLGLKSGVDYYALGYIEDQDVTELIKNAKFLVMPSLSEGGGSYPVEESLRMGVPVACSDIPVMREHLKGRSARIVWFDPESTDSIKSAMDEMISNYELYKESAIKGMQDPVQSWDEIADKYIQVFKMAIERFKRGQKK